MRLAFPEQIRKIDSSIIDKGVPSLLLMENAARSVFEVIRNGKSKKIAILCGGGNNGGDGYALARLLLNSGETVCVIECYPPSSEDCKKNASLYAAFKGKIYKRDAPGVKRVLSGVDLIVDGVFGTGFRSKLEKPLIELIEQINKLKTARLAIDIPSGVRAYDGSVGETAFRADKTVTFAMGKVGQFLYPGRDYCGEIIIKSEGFSREIMDRYSCCNLIDEDMVVRLLPERPANTYKGSYGKVLVIGGSEVYTGAPYLSALGASRSGCGMVYTFTPRDAATVVRTNLPEAIAEVSLDSHLVLKDIERVSSLIKIVDSVVIGPGLGRDVETIKTVLEILEAFPENKFVIDADGLYALSRDLTVLSSLKDTLLTPHIGEFSRLNGEKTDLKSLIDFCSEHGCRSILKGASSVLCNPAGNLNINITGTTGLAKGGSGDLLSGAIGSFAAQTGNLETAAILGMYFMGKAAELTRVADASQTASIVAKGFSKVYSHLERKSRSS